MEMPQVDFYVLEQGDVANARRVACRLAEKAWQMGHRVFVHTPSVTTAQEFDTLLWTFRQDSFVPHALAAQATAADPIVIGDGREPSEVLDVLINLTDAVPAFVERSRRVAELVAGDDADRAVARDRFRHYRERGYSIKSHTL